ncbi:MAG: CDP-2,3-bis-(O-geranylgeranyl)-sn-glycerol synthase [Infirmifilum sp.]
MFSYETLEKAILWILPAYVANGAPVVIVFLVRKMGKKTHPIDLRRIFIDGKRILGDNKSIEGFLGGVIIGSTLGALLQLLGLHNAFSALILSIGALTGDLTGAFIKRRLNLKPGDPAPLLDQLDFVFGAFAFQQLYNPVPLDYLVIVVVLTPLIHLSANLAAYTFGLKSKPW